jgi:predicted Zn-dependent protease
MSGLFYELGRSLGRVTVPTLRKSKWVWNSLTGTEEEAVRAEYAFGRTLAAELRATNEMITDPHATALANDLCQRLAARVRDKRRAFQCEVLRHHFPNAMALPGGFIFLSTALLDFCQGAPDVLGFVLGHELGHVLRGHAWDRMLNHAVVKMAGLVVSRAGALGPAGQWLRQNGMTLLQSAHSRDGELEADELGLRLALAAGLAPQGAFALLERIERLGPDRTRLGEYLATHPAPAERLTHLKRLLRQLRPTE